MGALRIYISNKFDVAKSQFFFFCVFMKFYLESNVNRGTKIVFFVAPVHFLKTFVFAQSFVLAKQMYYSLDLISQWRNGPDLSLKLLKLCFESSSGYLLLVK